MEDEGPVNSRLCSTSRLYPAAGQTRTRKRTGTSRPTEARMALGTLLDETETPSVK